MVRLVLPAAITLALLCQAVSAQTDNNSATGKLSFTVSGIETSSGTLYCRLYDGKEGFPDDGTFAIAQVKVNPIPGETVCAFDGLSHGIYALSVWHDVDDDGELDSNFIGIPKEPVGASNDAEGTFGPPKFKKAAVTLSGPVFEQTVTIE